MLESGILFAKFRPIFAKYLFISLAISSGSDLSFIVVISFFVLVFFQSLFRAFHSLALSPEAS